MRKAEEGLLVPAGEAVDGPQAADQPALDLGAGGRGRGQAEQLVGADAQDLGEPDERYQRWLYHYRKRTGTRR